MFWDGSQYVTQTAQKSRSFMVGNTVCHYGTVSGYSCGYAEDIHYRPSNNICNGQVCDAVWLKVRDSAYYNLNCQGGDSGGPFFWGSTAWGTLSGKNGGDTCDYAIVFTLDGLTWDGVNTRLYLP